MDDQPSSPTESFREGASHHDGDRIAERLGDFEILREIGRGGMGVVYEARQVSLNRHVALKVLPPGLGLTESAVRRFHREAEAAARLHHTHIVPVYSVGDERGCHYYAMELIDGEPLTAILRDLSGAGKSEIFEATITKLASSETTEHDATVAPKSDSTSLGGTTLSDSASDSRKWFDSVGKLIAEVAEALHYAHGQGIVHRDIKPANLLLSKDGRLCITDFGLAQVAQEPGMTMSGSLMGTPAYMSPEQVAAGRVKIDHRTDIYSLGTVLYEMLTLQRPFAGDSREAVLSGILTREPVPPRRLNPRVPVDLETICLKAIEKDPNRRYASAGLMAEDLRAYLARGLIAAKRTSRIRRAAKWVRNHPISSLATVAILGLALITSIAVRQSVRGSLAEARHLIASAESDVRDGTYRQGLAKIDAALSLAPNLAEARRTRARLLFGLRHDRELATLAREILAASPDDWEAHGWLAFLGRRGLADISPEEHAAAVERLAPKNADAWFVKGISASTDAEALRCFERALDVDPGHAWALLMKAEKLQGLHDYQRAWADLERFISVVPRSSRGRRFRASWSHATLRDTETALAWYDKALEVDPDDPFVFIERAGMYQRVLLDPERALEDLDRAAAMAPQSPLVWDWRSDALAALGRYEDALADARRSVALDPDRIGGHNAVIRALYRLKRFEEFRAAIDEFRRRADQWPNRREVAKAQWCLASFLRASGESDAAVHAARRAIELEPSMIEGYRELALARQIDEGREAVDIECARLSQIALREPAALLARARQLDTLCRLPELALADLARAIALAPLWPDPYVARTDLLERQRKHVDALADVDRAIALAPKWAEARFKRAALLFGQERWEEALADLERYSASGAESWEARRYQAESLAQLGREGDALDVLDTAIRARPHVHDGHASRARLLFLLGREREAAEAIDRAVSAEPRHAFTYFSRAALIASSSLRSCEAIARDLHKATELTPVQPWVHYWDCSIRIAMIGDRCPELFQPERCLTAARELVQQDPFNDEGQWLLGAALYRTGHYDAAHAALQRALDLASAPHPPPDYLLWLAMTEARLGRAAEARETYARALARMNTTWPKNPRYLMWKSEAESALTGAR